MMSSKEKLQNALTGVEDKFISESASPPERRRRQIPMRYLAASLVALLGVTVALLLTLINRPTYGVGGIPPMSDMSGFEIARDDEDVTVTKEDADGNAYVLVKAWNELIRLPHGYNGHYNFAIRGDSAWLVLLDQRTEKLMTYRMARGEPEAILSVSDFDSKYDEKEHVKGIDVFLDFRDGMNGSLFFCEYLGETDMLPIEYFFKTSDGGKSWQRQYLSAEASEMIVDGSEGKEILAGARMITDKSGVIYFDYNRERLGNRLYFTNDGGRSWFTPAPLPYPRLVEGKTAYYQNEPSFYHFSDINLSSLEYVDGEYVMIADGRYEDMYYTLRFTSADLRYWRYSDYYSFENYDELIECLRVLNSVKKTVVQESIEDADLYYMMRIPFSTHYEDVFDCLNAVAEPSLLKCVGYALMDMNRDGADELIFLDINYNIRGIFTTVDGVVTAVDYNADFWKTGAIDGDGNIYVSYYGNGEVSSCYVMRLMDDGRLGNSVSFRIMDRGVGYIEYRVSGNDVTREEYEALMEPYREFFAGGNAVTQGIGLEVHPVVEGGFDPK